jgi:hypothetical protein
MGRAEDRSKRDRMMRGGADSAERTERRARMGKYRARPVVFEAVQYVSGGPIPDGVCTGGRGCKSSGAPDGSVPHIHTLEGDHTVRDGDFVITGVHGEKYPCKPDIFAKTYEPVEAELSYRDTCELRDAT